VKRDTGALVPVARFVAETLSDRNLPISVLVGVNDADVALLIAVQPLGVEEAGADTLLVQLNH
jgi:hypothetical protein